MTADKGIVEAAGKKICARCHRPFVPKKVGDRYGPKCAKKNRNNHIEVRNEKGKTVAVIV